MGIADIELGRTPISIYEDACLSRRVASPVTATTDFLATDILNKCSGAVPALVAPSAEPNGDGGRAPLLPACAGDGPCDGAGEDGRGGPADAAEVIRRDGHPVPVEQSPRRAIDVQAAYRSCRNLHRRGHHRRLLALGHRRRVAADRGPPAARCGEIAAPDGRPPSWCAGSGRERPRQIGQAGRQGLCLQAAQQQGLYRRRPSTRARPIPANTKALSIALSGTGCTPFSARARASAQPIPGLTACRGGACPDRYRLELK